MSILRQQMIKDIQLRRLSILTQKSYVNSVEGLAKHYHTSPDKIDAAKLQDYILFLTNERKLAYSSVNQILSGLRFFFSVTISRNDLAVSIPQRKSEKHLPQILSKDELLSVFSAIRNQKHRTMLMTAYAGGLRVSEITRLKVTDIDSSRMMIRIDQGKGSKDRYTILSERLLKELRDYWKTYRPNILLFPAARDKNKILTRATPHLVFQKIKNKVGIKKKVSFHTLRHCFATHLLEAGVDIRTIQILMGHSSITSTALYLHIAKKNIGSTKSPLDLLNVPNIKKFPSIGNK